jgi:hypothetical protein
VTGLGPFKVEVYSSSPYIAVFHDFLTDHEMKWIIDYSLPRLSKSRDQSYKTVTF